MPGRLNYSDSMSDFISGSDHPAPALLPRLGKFAPGKFERISAFSPETQTTKYKTTTMNSRSEVRTGFFFFFFFDDLRRRVVRNAHTVPPPSRVHGKYYVYRVFLNVELHSSVGRTPYLRDAKIFEDQHCTPVPYRGIFVRVFFSIIIFKRKKPPRFAAKFYRNRWRTPVTRFINTEPDPIVVE